MIRLPTPPSGLGGLLRWAAELTDRLHDLLTQTSTPGTLLHEGSRGTGRQVIGGVGGGPGGGEIQIRGQWSVAESYLADELVYCDTTSERDDGTQAGLYQALNSVTGGTHPSVNTTDWRMVARGHWGKITFRTGTAKFVVDTTNNSLLWYADTGSEDDSIQLELADLSALAAGHRKMEIHIDTFCVGVTVKDIGWIRTVPADHA